MPRVNFPDLFELARGLTRTSYQAGWEDCAKHLGRPLVVADLQEMLRKATEHSDHIVATAKEKVNA